MKRILSIVAIVAFLVAMVIWRVAHPSGEVGTDLALGWIGFVGRVIPRVHIRWDGVAIFASGLAAVTVISHYLLHWLYRETRKEAQPPRSWKLRWTLSLVAGVVVLFVAGISMIGVTHQTAWLATSPEPIFGTNLAFVNSTSRANLIDQYLASENHVDVFKTLPAERRTNPGEVRHSWATQLYPFLGPYIRPDIDFKQEWNAPANERHFRAVIPELINPELRTPPLRNADGFGLNHYAGNANIFDRPANLQRDHIRNLSADLILFGEVNSRFVPWGQPENSRDPELGIGTPHGFGGAPGSKGAQFVMLDGSVRMIDQNIDPKMLRQLSRVKTK